MLSAIAGITSHTGYFESDGRECKGIADFFTVRCVDRQRHAGYICFVFLVAMYAWFYTLFLMTSTPTPTRGGGGAAAAAATADYARW